MSLFNTWLKPLKVYEVDGKLITVVVPSEQAAIGSITSVNATKYPSRLLSVY